MNARFKGYFGIGPATIHFGIDIGCLLGFVLVLYSLMSSSRSVEHFYCLIFIFCVESFHLLLVFGLLLWNTIIKKRPFLLRLVFYVLIKIIFIGFVACTAFFVVFPT
jgi:hypothetical protein